MSGIREGTHETKNRFEVGRSRSGRGDCLSGPHLAYAQGAPVTAVEAPGASPAEAPAGIPTQPIQDDREPYRSQAADMKSEQSYLKVTEDLTRHPEQSPAEGVGCVSTEDSFTSSGQSLVAGSSLPRVSCDNLPGVVWHMSRFSWCRRIILNYSHIKIEKGTTKITGTARYAVQQDIGLDPNSNKFGEHVDVTLIEKHGTVKSPQVSFESGCTGCNPLYARPWQGFTAIGEQETKQKDFNRYVPIQNGTKVDVDWGWEMVIKHAGVALDTKITWGDVGARCDNKVAGNRGCVVPAFTPTLYIDYAKRQAAAAMIVEAQQKNLQHWGLRGKGKPLTRLADDKETQKNRDIIRPSD
ncbi:hypothetical protein M1P56_17140 [Streptomyces sp. HU2014]|uniref:hypothetical protein n=1 Tax=Streptomyces sp. HU2014 TaxID=2939414 RepID=UPI00200DD49F|nr:hypothetical protein [Streptomyces sp. HU2014]UQI45955.1 hypothetical protein M1P56_17140 [Streptomyces sp. HU2014]